MLSNLTKPKIEFVSYDGKYPNLCSGTLILKINDEQVDLGHCLCSGGIVRYIRETEDFVVTQGEWSVDVPEKYEQYKEEITRVVNENVEFGCCGGCV